MYVWGSSSFTIANTILTEKAISNRQHADTPRNTIALPTALIQELREDKFRGTPWGEEHERNDEHNEEHHVKDASDQLHEGKDFNAVDIEHEREQNDGPRQQSPMPPPEYIIRVIEDQKPLDLRRYQVTDAGASCLPCENRNRSCFSKYILSVPMFL